MSWNSVLQPSISPLPNLRKKWFSAKVICIDEGWSFWLSSSGAGRIDAYHYEEKGRQLTLGGEGRTVMDIIIPPHLTWDDDLSSAIDDDSSRRILFNITAAIQWSGFSVSFSRKCEDSAQPM
jgi:hypothetical protein